MQYFSVAHAELARASSREGQIAPSVIDSASGSAAVTTGLKRELFILFFTLIE